jgi:peptidyl-prolyl cis-trans isomerase C
MLIRTSLFTSAALALCLALPASADTADTVVATINGTDITLGHMIVVRASLPEQYRQLPDDVLFSGILDQLIQQTVLAQVFDGETPQRVRIALENERRSLLAAERIDSVLSERISPERLEAAYDAKYGGYNEGREFNASHILVATEDEAKAIVTTLEGGADFAELAKEKSTGPSGPRGGELGWFGTGAMVPAFEQAVVDMDKDAISAPVQTQFGWHVIKLNDVRDKAAPALDEVKEELERELATELVDTYIKELTDEAVISRITSDEIDLNLLKDLTLLEK